METQALAGGKKNAKRLGAHIVFCDESGFLLIPTVAKTWAPRGKTPILRHRTRRDKVSAISGISVSPRYQRLGLYYRLYLNNIGHAQVCEFLRHLLRHLRGQVIVLLDNGTIHKGEVIRAFRSRYPRLHIDYFPGYAPELNPDEGVWSLTKGKLANSRPDNKEELLRQVNNAMIDIRRSSANLRGCIVQSDLPSFLR
jgi:transposase